MFRCRLGSARALLGTSVSRRVLALGALGPLVLGWGATLAAADPTPSPTATPPGAPSPAVPAPTAPPVDPAHVLSVQLGAAEHRLGVLAGERAVLDGRRQTLTTKVAKLNGQISALRSEQQHAVQELAAAEAHARSVAVRAYKDDSASELLTMLSAASDTHSLEVGTALLEQADRSDRRKIREFADARDHADSETRKLASQEADLQGELATIDSQYHATDLPYFQNLVTTTSLAAQLHEGVPDLQGIGLTILGKSQLGAQQLLAWYTSTGVTPHLTVAMPELIRDYLEEGSAEGIRGDVAFAQSIIETASFSFPSYGQVDVPANNFAGIGACDSCAHGMTFPDARTGVRAQMQLLRAYADPAFSSSKLAHPGAMPNLDHLSVKGCCPTWFSLSGVWASGPSYGAHVVALYRQIAAWPAAAPPAVPAPPASPAGSP